jgi:hypothetical protein
MDKLINELVQLFSLNHILSGAPSFVNLVNLWFEDYFGFIATNAVVRNKRF